jgi:hypothetical protein
MGVTVDLTKIDEARAKLVNPAALSAAIGCIMPPSLPFPLSLVEPLTSLLETLLRSPGKLGRDDAEYIEQIIQKGAESRVDEMTIIVDRETALGVDLKLGKVRGKQPFNFTIGERGDTRYEIKIKYRAPVPTETA